MASNRHYAIRKFIVMTQGCGFPYILDNYHEVQEQWLPQVKYMGYKKYAELRYDS